MLLFTNLLFLLTTSVLSDLVPVEDSKEKDVHYRREERDSTTRGEPIDLSSQLQNLALLNGEDKNIDESSSNDWSNHVPGVPGTDYPSLDKIPETSFSCHNKVPGGYYADPETGCQVFHICNIGGDKSSFLCPIGSIFNQRYFVCDWWYGFHCEEAESLYTKLEKRSNEDNKSESNESMTSSELIGNYRSIQLPNNNKDTRHRELLGKKSSYKQKPEQIENNERSIFDETENFKQFNVNYDYPNEENEFQHDDSKKIEINERNKYEENMQNKRKIVVEYFTDKSNMRSEPTDHEPRGFSFNRRQSRENIYDKVNKLAHGARQLDSTSNINNSYEDFSIMRQINLKE